MLNKCPICHNPYNSLKLNGLLMRHCPKCGLVWRKNFNISINYYQTKKNNLSEKKIKDRISNSKNRIKIFKRYVDLNNLLDIDAGEGVFLKVLNDYGYKNIFGIEPNIKDIEFAKANNLKMINGTIDNIKKVISENNIHTVTMFHLIEHLKNPLKSLKLIFESLNKGERLIIETPDFESYTIKKTNYKHKLIYPEHFFYFNQKNLRLLLGKIGFKIIATGKRDFNQNNFSIRESLFRLGLIKKNNNCSYNKNNQIKTYLRDKNSKNIIFIKKIIRKILNKLVIKFNRLDYIWIIVEK